MTTSGPPLLKPPYQPIGFQPPLELERVSCFEQLIGKDVSLYVHVPFCLSRCHYCDFLVVCNPTKEALSEYVEALLSELRRYAMLLSCLKARVDVVHFGGGTPSLLEPSLLQTLLEYIFASFTFSDRVELVFEASPSTVQPELIRVLSRYPCPKLQMGVQSFSEQKVHLVGRTQSPKKVFRAIQLGKDAGLASVGIDLICGLPFGSPTEVVEDLQTARSLGVDHIALYPLWVYPGTVLWQKWSAGEVQLYSASLISEALSEAGDYLRDAGYVQYTAFHWGFNGQSRHLYGLKQMEDGDWIGVGVGAVSHFSGHVSQNTTSLNEYIASALSGGDCIRAGRHLNAREQMARSFLLGLRRLFYFRRSFIERFGFSIDQIFTEEISKLSEQGYLVDSGPYLGLTVDGIVNLGDIEQLVGRRISPSLGRLNNDREGSV